MEITEVKVFPISEEKLKAFVSIVFDGCFMVNDIKIIQGREGLFISMPSRRKKNGEFKDVAHPLNNETRERLTAQILEEYDRVRANGGRRPERKAAPPPVEPQSVERLETTTEGAPQQEGKSLEKLQEDLLREEEWTTPERPSSEDIA